MWGIFLFFGEDVGGIVFAVDMMYTNLLVFNSFSGSVFSYLDVTDVAVGFVFGPLDTSLVVVEYGSSGGKELFR